MFIALCINLKIKSTHTKYQCIQPAFEIALQLVHKGKGKVNKKQIILISVNTLTLIQHRFF